MKKQFIVGMMLVTTAMSFSAHAAGMKGTETTARESIKRYVENMKKFASEVKAPSAELRSQQVAKALDTTVDQLNISGGEKASIKSLISSSKNNQDALTGSLAAIIGAKSATTGKSDAESTSINKAADASLKLMSNAVLIGAKETSSFLNTKELAETRDALKKLVAMPDKFITFETKERDSYANIIMKSDEMSAKSETFEEAFVKSIMETQKVSKDKALEIVRKLKECV